MKIPKQLKVGKIAFDIWTLGDGRVAFDYKQGTKRKIVARKSLEDLREVAERVANLILAGETEAQQLTAEECRIYVAARKAVAPTGFAVDQVARDFAKIWEETGGASLFDLAKVWKTHRPQGHASAPPSAEILKELLGQMQDNRRSDKYRAGIERDLSKFALEFPDLALISEKDLREWLRIRQTPQGDPVSARRRDNYRDAIVLLFRFAKAQNYLPRDRQSAAEMITRISEGGEVTTYTPGELQLFLEHVSQEWKPWMLIGAFAGLRSSEIFRLDWSHIKWEHLDEHQKSAPVIAVPRKVAKKVRTSRLVPIPLNLQQWLEPWRGAVGPIYPQAHENWKALESAQSREIVRLKKLTGLKWDINALRHSFGSHRLAIVKSYDQVAIEMGNSPAKVRENYNDPKSEGEGKAYFALVPPDHANVVTMPLDLRFG